MVGRRRNRMDMIIHDFVYTHYNEKRHRDYSSFSKFESWANYYSSVFKSLRTGSDSVSRKAIQILADFSVKLNQIYGFEREEGMGYVLDYFIDKRWTYVHWKN